MNSHHPIHGSNDNNDTDFLKRPPTYCPEPSLNPSSFLRERIAHQAFDLPYRPSVERDSVWGCIEAMKGFYGLYRDDKIGVIQAFYLYVCIEKVYIACIGAFVERCAKNLLFDNVSS